MRVRGREKFQKHKRLISLLTRIFSLFSRSARVKLLIHYRDTKGVRGLAVRYALLRTLAKHVGDNVSVYPNVYLAKTYGLSIGDNVSIHPLCYLDADGGIEIGSDVSIARNVSIISFNHRYDDLTVPIKEQAIERKKITIEDNVWIGANATLLAGVTVRSGSIIGAASVVTHDVEENSIVAGNPAKVIKYRQ